MQLKKCGHLGLPSSMPHKYGRLLPGIVNGNPIGHTLSKVLACLPVTLPLCLIIQTNYINVSMTYRWESEDTALWRKILLLIGMSAILDI
jgi:hypothetical protein